MAATLPSPSISPSEWLAVAGSSIRAIASLAARLEQAGDDQGQRQIAAAARQHGVERDAPRGAERREHVTVRQRADDSILRPSFVPPGSVPSIRKPGVVKLQH